MTDRQAFTSDGVGKAWGDALALWDMHVSLSPPAPFDDGMRAGWKGSDPLAFINMETRQVVVNYPMLHELEVEPSFTAILAHEIGHHVRYPHTLRLAADLRIMEQRMIPWLGQSLTNLFFDLQVNEVVGRTRADDLCALYQAFERRKARREDREPGQADAVFAFYLAIYEELWDRPRNSLVGEQAAAWMDGRFGGWRAEARMFAQTFWSLPDDFLQFAYFCGRFARFIETPQDFRMQAPLAGDVGEPSPEDVADAVWGNPHADRAIEEGEERGWLEGGKTRQGGSPIDNLNRALAGMPGNAQQAFRRALVGRIYRRLVDRHIFELPAKEQAERPDPFLPTTTEAWEQGDDPRLIDWTQTVLSAGPLASALPLKRELEPDDPPDRGRDVPPIEIYLDTSGSMPSPDRAVNAMTLAAQILSASAIRAGSKVRAVIYSSGKPKVSEWMSDEETARQFLLHYSGGGTQYPFDFLKKSAAEKRGVLRVIISDTDFFWNLKHTQGSERVVREAARQSVLLAAVLSAQAELAKRELARLLKEPNFRVVPVEHPSQLARAAAELASALFD